MKNFHKPVFECISSFGPTHDPTFVMECKLDSIVRTATAGVKFTAKHMAAKAVLDILKEVSELTLKTPFEVTTK